MNGNWQENLAIWPNKFALLYPIIDSTSVEDFMTDRAAYDPALGIAYVNGSYMPLAEAAIPITDRGFVRSDATYDVTHVWKGRFFRLDDHIERFLAYLAAGGLLAFASNACAGADCATPMCR